MVKENTWTSRQFVQELDAVLRKYNARNEYLRKTFSYTETAAELGVSRRTLQRWVNSPGSHKVPYTMVGKRPKFTGADIEEIRSLMKRGLLYEEHIGQQQQE